MHKHAELQYIPTIIMSTEEPADQVCTIDDDRRELVAVERLFAELLASGGKLADRGAELNARMTAILSTMHGILDAIGTQSRSSRMSLAGPLRRWRAERTKIAEWLERRVTG